MKIGPKPVGGGAPAFLIAEVAQAHDGSLGTAHAYIDAAADAGVDAIKFQTHIAEAESTREEPFRVKFSRQDETRHAYWKRMEFTFAQWEGLAEHARDKNLVFLSSPFSMVAVELLEKLDMPAWKFGAGETVSGDLLEAVLKTGRPLLVSTGMSSYPEIDALVQTVMEADRELALFQCTSKYPVPLGDVGLNVLEEFRERYGCPVGLSDHSGTVYPALAAMARGADLVEAHIVFHKGCFGPDTPASLTPRDFRLLADARGAFHEMATHPVDKNGMAEALGEMRALFGKSLALRHPLKAGAVLTAEMLTAKKPASGIPKERIRDVIGKRLCRDVPNDRLLHPDDFTP